MKLSDLKDSDIKVIDSPLMDENDERLRQTTFKDTIKKIESRGGGGYQALGQPIEYGLSKGKRAIGAYQFTPETIDTIANNSKDKDLKKLADLSDEEKQEQLLKNPKLQDKLFEEHSTRVFQLAGGDPLKAAWAWNQGPGSIPKFKEEHDYIQKYKKISGMDKPGRQLAANEPLKLSDLLKKDDNAPLRLSDLKADDIKVVDELKADIPVQEIKKQYSELESAGLGLVQGGTLGFADEVTGGVKALGSKLTGEQKSLAELYQQYRDLERKRYQEAQEANPMSYLGGNVAGGVATAFIPGLNIAKGATLGQAALKAGALGAATGLGSSEADLTKGEVGGALVDTAIGGTLGATTGALGQKLGQALTPANTEARAVVRATKALGEKALPENLPMGKAVLEEGVLPMMGGSKGIEQAVTGRISDIEKNIVQPTLSAVSQSNALPNVTASRQPIQSIISNVTKETIDNIAPSSTAKSSAKAIGRISKYWSDQLKAAGGDPSKLNEVRKLIDKEAQQAGTFSKFNPELGPKAEFLGKLRDAVNIELRDIASSVSEGAGQQLKTAMGRQSPLIGAKQAAEALVEKDLLHPPGSIMDILKNPLTNPRAAIIGATTYLANPTAKIGLATGLAAEKITKQPVGRLGNIISARSQYALSKGLGKAGVQPVVQGMVKGAEAGLRSTGVQSNTQSLYTTSSSKLKEIADSFSQDKATENIGIALNNAINSGDEEAKNKVLFAAEQRPEVRLRLKELLKVQEETDLLDNNDMGFGDES